MCYNDDILTKWGNLLYEIQRTDKVCQTETAYESDGICATSRRELYKCKSLGERKNHAQLPRSPHLRATV